VMTQVGNDAFSGGVDLLSGALRDTTLARGEGGWVDPTDQFNILTEVSSSVEQYVRRYDQQLKKARAVYGEYLCLPYILCEMQCPDVYAQTNFKYFWWANYDRLTTLNGVEIYKSGGMSSEDRKYIREYDKLTKMMTNDEAFKKIVWCTHNLYSTHRDDLIKGLPYNERKYDTVRLVIAGFTAHLRCRLTDGKPMTGDSRGNKTRKSQCDIIERTHAGGDMLKAHVRRILRMCAAYKDDLDNTIEALGMKKHKKDTSSEKTGRAIKKTLRETVKIFHKKAGYTDRQWLRKTLFAGWYMIHSVFKAHTGQPIPALVPSWGGGRVESMQAMADLIEASVRIKAFSEESPTDDRYNNLLHVALSHTPGTKYLISNKGETIGGMASLITSHIKVKEESGPKNIYNYVMTTLSSKDRTKAIKGIIVEMKKSYNNGVKPIYKVENKKYRDEEAKLLALPTGGAERNFLSRDKKAVEAYKTAEEKIVNDELDMWMGQLYKEIEDGNNKGGHADLDIARLMFECLSTVRKRVRKLEKYNIANPVKQRQKK
jgi:hypothetical protein